MSDTSRRMKDTYISRDMQKRTKRESARRRYRINAMIERAVASDTISLPRVEIGSQRLRLARRSCSARPTAGREHRGMTYRSCGRFNRFNGLAENECQQPRRKPCTHTRDRGRTDAATI